MIGVMVCTGAGTLLKTERGDTMVRGQTVEHISVLASTGAPPHSPRVRVVF